MHIVESIGLLAAFLTTTAFFPQVIKTIKTKSTGDLSLPMYTLMFTGTVSWLVYGLMKHDLPVTLANAVSSMASFVIFYYKMKEVRSAKKKQAL
jgi:MtN3 and saliva related transmembrane protein